jgi:hypothetical protein
VEGLVIVIAELLLAFLAPAFAVLGAFLAALAELVTGLVALARRGRTVPRATPPRPPRRWPRRLLHGAAALGALAGVAVLTVNLFFLDPALRWTLARVEARTGYAVDYATARGNLFTGRLAMTGARVTREAGPGIGMDVAAERVAIDVALPSLLIGTATLENLDLAGLTGRIAKPQRPGTATCETEAPRPRRDFVVERARIERIDLEVAGGGERPHRVEIATASAEPFRSRTALFDLLFRSNLDARINGIPLLVETAVISDRGRQTRWAFEEVPVATLADLTDRAPVSWLSGGTVTATVEDRWDLTETDIDMDWRIAVDGVAAASPDSAGATERLLAEAFARALAGTDGKAEFAFTLTLDREGLAAAGSDDLTALWDALRDGMAGAIAASFDAQVGEVREGIDGFRDRLFDYLDRRGRQPEGGD